MNTSSHAEHFFETDAAQEKRQKRHAKAGNEFGNPINLNAKILGAVEDPFSPFTSIFAALSTGRACRINLETSSVTTKYVGPTAPVSCVAVSQKDGLVFGGSWDKVIWSWDVSTAKASRKYVGHSDFVKALLIVMVEGVSMLISGGSDKKIIVWDIGTGTRLHTLQDPTATMLAMQHLALDPVASTAEEAVVFGASSDPHIRRWRVRKGSATHDTDLSPNAGGDEASRLRPHETSVYKLVFDVDGEDGDLWTASADGTVKCLARSRNFSDASVEEDLPHGDYVRAVVATDRWVVSAGRDEDVKVWDRATGRLYCSLAGHFDEVTDLVLLRTGTGGAGGGRDRVCSVGIDGTVRTWPLAKEDLDRTVEEIKAANEPKPPEAEEEVQQGKGASGLTAEEEAELAELMDDD